MEANGNGRLMGNIVACNGPSIIQNFAMVDKKHLRLIKTILFSKENLDVVYSVFIIDFNCVELVFFYSCKMQSHGLAVAKTQSIT